MAKEPEKSKRPSIAVPAEQGEFRHLSEGAEAECVTGYREPHCECGAYDLEWFIAAAEVKTLES